MAVEDASGDRRVVSVTFTTQNSSSKIPNKKTEHVQGEIRSLGFSGWFITRRARLTPVQQAAYTASPSTAAPETS